MVKVKFDKLLSKIREDDFPDGGFIFQGSIAVNTDFPLIADVQVGWYYTITADVTDDAGVLYTNTGQSFIIGDEIIWDGTQWVLIGPNSIWLDDGTDVKTVNTLRNLDIQGSGLKNTTVSSNVVLLNDVSNIEYNTINKTIIGSSNEILSGLTTHTSNIDIHRSLDDTTTTNVNLWSAEKINNEIQAENIWDRDTTTSPVVITPHIVGDTLDLTSSKVNVDSINYNTSYTPTGSEPTGTTY